MSMNNKYCIKIKLEASTIKLYMKISTENERGVN